MELFLINQKIRQSSNQRSKLSTSAAVEYLGVVIQEWGLLGQRGYLPSQECLGKAMGRYRGQGPKPEVVAMLSPTAPKLLLAGLYLFG